MSKIYELVKDNVPANLWHPQIGNVLWVNLENAGFALYFADGLEQGEPLVADVAVLHDDKWVLLAGKPKKLNIWQIWIKFNGKSAFVGVCFGETFRKACESYFKHQSPDLFDWDNFTYLGSELFEEDPDGL